MNKWMAKILFYALCSFVFLSQAAADDKSAAEEFLKSKLDTVFKVLQKKDVSQQAKNREVEEIVTPMFDFKLMAKLSLGKKPQRMLKRITEKLLSRREERCPSLS